jgi:hypothetical protein
MHKPYIIHRLNKETPDRQTKKDRLTKEKTDRQTGRQTDRQTDRQADRQRVRKKKEQTDRGSGTTSKLFIYLQTSIWTNGQITRRRQLN